MCNIIEENNLKQNIRICKDNMEMTVWQTTCQFTTNKNELKENDCSFTLKSVVWV